MLKDSNNSPTIQEKLIVFLLAAIQFSHVLDFVVLMPLGPMLMRDLDIGPIEFASLVSAYNFSAGIAGLSYGVIADRFDRKVLLIYCFIGFIVSTFMCGIVSAFPLLLLARVLAGCFGGVLTSIVLALVSDLIPYQRRGTAMSAVMSSFSVASVIGVPIGLIIANANGWNYTFVVISLFSVLLLPLLVRYIPSVRPPTAEDKGWKLITRLLKIVINPKYMPGYSLVTALGLSGFLIIPFLSPYSVKNIGIAETDIKYLYLFGGAFTVITARIFGRATDKIGALKMFVLLALTSTAPIYLMTHAPQMSLNKLLVISVFFMTIVSGRFIPCMTLLTQVAEDKDKGAFMAVLNSVRALATAVATLIGGMIVSETADGKLLHYDTAGNLSIMVTLTTIILAIIVERKLQRSREITH